MNHFFLQLIQVRRVNNTYLKTSGLEDSKNIFSLNIECIEKNWAYNLDDPMFQNLIRTK